MQRLEVSCAVRRFFKSLRFKGLKSDKKNGYLTRRPMEIYHNTSLNSFLELETFQTKL